MTNSFSRSLLALLLLLLSGCGSNQTAQPTTAPASSSTAPATPTAAAAATANPEQFTNPVINRDFPDPDVLQVDATYYVYATNAGVQHVQAARSDNLVDWEALRNPFPALPDWAAAGFTWAPEVTANADGTGYLLYFTARHAASGRQCIGVASATAPEGPFAATEDEPLICQLELGGSIDAASFVASDGTRYLLWKNDGNCCGFPVNIYIQQLSADGLALSGEPTALITNDQWWEGALVEAPTLWEHEQRYYLFYSANSYAGVDYAIGYAVADAPTGPYVKPQDDPLVATSFDGQGAIGPGGQDIVLDDDGDVWMIYHSWDPGGTFRRLMIDELTWNASVPSLDGPDLAPQPRP